MAKDFKPPQYRTFKQFRKRHPWASEGGLRWQRHNCETNGFESAFVKIGRRVLIDEEEYFRCVRRQQKGLLKRVRRDGRV